MNTPRGILCFRRAVTTLLLASFFFGHLFAFTFLMLPGAAAIEPGMFGFTPSGYSIGERRIVGWTARFFGGAAISLGAGLILFVLIGVLRR